jgi:hypothetical protein
MGGKGEEVGAAGMEATNAFAERFVTWVIARHSKEAARQAYWR